MRVVFAALLSLLLAAPAAAEVAPPYSGLPGTSWIMIEWRGQTLDPRATPRLAFGGPYQMSGFGGCNRFTGYYAVQGERIVLVAQSWTKMYCRDRAFMDSQMNLDLKRVVRLAIGSDGATLVAHADDGAVIFRYRRAAPGE